MIVHCVEPVYHEGDTHFQCDLDLDKKTADNLIKLGIVTKGKGKTVDVDDQ